MMIILKDKVIGLVSIFDANIKCNVMSHHPEPMQSKYTT
jgi:hypothetical protein